MCISGVKATVGKIWEWKLCNHRSRIALKTKQSDIMGIVSVKGNKTFMKIDLQSVAWVTCFGLYLSYQQNTIVGYRDVFIYSFVVMFS